VLFLRRPSIHRVLCIAISTQISTGCCCSYYSISQHHTRADQWNQHKTRQQNKTKPTCKPETPVLVVIGIFCDRRRSQTDPSPQTCLASCSLPRPRPVRRLLTTQTASPHPSSCLPVHAVSTRYTHADAAAATTLRQASPRRRTTQVHRRRALVALPCLALPCLALPCLAAYLDVWTSQPPMLTPATA